MILSHLRGRGTVRTLALGASLALVLTACGDDDPDPSGTTTETMGPGNTAGISDEPCENAPTGTNDKCIYLGQVTDLTGVFAAAGTQIAAAIHDFWDAVNAEGGINGYDVDTRTHVEDTGYDPEAHADAYERIQPEILALAQSLGTNHTIGILDAMEADSVIGVPATLWSGWNFESNLLTALGNYCLESINAVDYAIENYDIESVLSVHLPGDYGGDSQAGVAAAAAATGITELPHVEAAPGDIDGPVEAIVGGDTQPDLVVLATGVADAAAIIGQSMGRGFQGRFIGLVPLISVPLIAKIAPTNDNPDDDALGDALVTSQFATEMEPFGSDTPGHQAAAANASEGNPTNEFYTLGWAGQYGMKTLLEAVFADGEGSREEMVSTIDGLTVDFQGMLPTTTMGGDANENVKRSTSFGSFNADAPLGVVIDEADYIGPTAAAYEFNAPCIEL